MDPDFAHSAPDDPKPKTWQLRSLHPRGTSFARARHHELATPLSNIAHSYYARQEKHNLGLAKELLVMREIS